MGSLHILACVYLMALNQMKCHAKYAPHRASSDFSRIGQILLLVPLHYNISLKQSASE